MDIFILRLMLRHMHTKLNIVFLQAAGFCRVFEVAVT